LVSGTQPNQFIGCGFFRFLKSGFRANGETGDVNTRGNAALRNIALVGRHAPKTPKAADGCGRKPVTGLHLTGWQVIGTADVRSPMWQVGISELGHY
jgi:hypothetical protein